MYIYRKDKNMSKDYKITEENRVNISQNLANLRKKRGLTQTALAEMLFVSNKTVSKWERGAGYPELNQLIKLSQVLGTTIDALVCGKRHGIAIAGNILTDIVKMIDFIPEKGMLANILSMSRAVGGCVPNTGIDLAKIEPSLGVSAIGLVGDDEGGRYVLSQLQNHNIDISQVGITKEATGFSDVMTLKSTGERTFYHHRGANASFAPNDVNLSSLNCKMLHIGYILLLDKFDEDDPEYGTAMAHFLHDVKKAGIKTSLDLVSCSDSTLFAKKVIPPLKYTDNAMMNEIECCAVSGLKPRDADGNLIVENIKNSMQMLLDAGVKERVIIHCPECGFILNRESGFTSVPSLKLPEGYIKGSVGAGDAFSAGCLYGIYHGYSDEQILEFASGAAACNLTTEDAVSGMKSKDEIFKLIEKLGKR